MIDFETALDRVQQSEGLDRGAAVARLRELHSAGYIPEGKISDLESHLYGERAKSIGERATAGFLGEMTYLPERLMKMVPGAESFESPRETMLKRVPVLLHPQHIS